MAMFIFKSQVLIAISKIVVFLAIIFIMSIISFYVCYLLSRILDEADGEKINTLSVTYDSDGRPIVNGEKYVENNEQ